MQVARIHLESFKQFEDVTIEIRNEFTNSIAKVFLLLGDNGTGKTTVLQALALALDLAQGKIKSVDDFGWLGWLPGRYWRWGKPVVEIELHFTDDEIAATQEAARRWFDTTDGKNDFVEPGDSKVVTLRLVGNHIDSPASRAGKFQLRGRIYAAGLLRGGDPTARQLFERLPGFFWFDQLRNLGTVSSPAPDLEDTHPTVIGFKPGVARLRYYLNNWREPDQELESGRLIPNFLGELEAAYKLLFPGRSFAKPEPIYSGGAPTPAGRYFMLTDGKRTYDIEEMSGGEQSVFPVLYEIVRQRIRNSLVLIDEVDLNLHPPLAQGLVTMLPKLAPGCQFLITSHSEAVVDSVLPAQVYRLPGGRLCL